MTGDIKDEKSFSGFFINQNATSHEWLVVDFFDKGKLIYQLYSDIDLLFLDQDGDYFRKLSKKNIFENNTLVDGIEILPTKKTKSEISVNIVRFIENAHTTKYYIILMGIHYAEIINLKTISNGYKFTTYDNNYVTVTYSENKRKIEYHNNSDNRSTTLNSKYYSFEEGQNLTENGFYSYLLRDEDLFIEQVDTFRPIDASSDGLKMLINSFFYFHKDITSDDLIFFAENLSWNNPFVVASYLIKDGERTGAFIEKNADQTYSLYRTEKHEKELLLSNSTILEMGEFIKSLTR